MKKTIRLNLDGLAIARKADINPVKTNTIVGQIGKEKSPEEIEM